LKIKRSFILISLVAIFVLIQLIPVERKNPPINNELNLKAPPEIITILEESCFDCHSNQTNWPFYSYIAPVSWLVAHDVEEGRGHLNFSEWNQLPIEKMQKIKEELIEEISQDKMPLPIYLITHSGAKLTDEQKMKLKVWVESDDD